MKRLLKYIHFVHSRRCETFSLWNILAVKHKTNAFKSEYCDKTPSHSPPLKYLTMWEGGGRKKRMYVYIVRFKEYIEFKYLYKNIVSV